MLNIITLENEQIKVDVIPKLGGKIASFFHKGKDFEVLFQPTMEYKIPKLYSNFSEFDASGFDDAFPNINQETVDGVNYPDHGEIWTTDFNYHKEDNMIILKADSKILPYSYEKEVNLIDNALLISYKIKNNGIDPLPCIWTAHCLTKCEEDMEIIFPPETRSFEVVQDSKYLGSVGSVLPYPYEQYSLNKVFPKSANKYEKYYVNHKIETGRCGIYYPSKDISFIMEYDVEKLPYLGFWVTEGGFRGDYNCALEPSSGYCDAVSIAQKNEKISIIKANEAIEFKLKLSFSPEK